MALYSYVLDHDYGFAPNPFFGVCTLATCKPIIRAKASPRDYIVGTGCAKRGRRGYLVYFMRVGRITTFDEYWRDPEFQDKRPYLRSSKKRAMGDNIYHRDRKSGAWIQENSVHSHEDGSPKQLNIERDTKSENVLIADQFAYWGGFGPEIPAAFRNYNGDDICAKRGHRVNFVDGLEEDFLRWALGLGERGYVSRPLDW